jgi:arylsulfatase
MQPRLVTERPQVSKPRSRFTYYPHGQVVPAFAAPHVYNRPHSITADVEVPADGADGVLVAQGGIAGGYILYMKDGRLHYAHNYAGRDLLEVSSPATIPAGHRTLRYEFEPTGPPDLKVGKGTPGRAQLYVDGVLVANADFPHTTPLFFELEGLNVGVDEGSPVIDGRYPSPFAFTGTIHSVTIDVSGDLIADDEASLNMLMARQ